MRTTWLFEQSLEMSGCRIDGEAICFVWAQYMRLLGPTIESFTQTPGSEFTFRVLLYRRAEAQYLSARVFWDRSRWLSETLFESLTAAVVFERALHDDFMGAGVAKPLYSRVLYLLERALHEARDDSLPA